MNAKVVSEVAFSSTFDFVHNYGQEIRRLVVEKDGETYAAITPYKGHVFVITKFEFSKDTKIIGEVDVPDDLVKRIFEADEAQKQLFTQVNKFIES